MLIKIKKILNKFGFDIKRYRSTIQDIVIPLNIETVLDIGANDGNFSLYARNLFPDAKIYAFEPLKDCCERIRSKMVNDANFECFNYALGEKNEMAQITRSSFHPSSSILKMDDLHKKLYPKTAGETKEIIEVKKLDDLNINIKGSILMKIDVQGYESKVLAGSTKILKEVAAVIIESSFIPLYEDQPLFADIVKILDENNFSYYGDTGRHYDKTNKKLIYEDSLFLKKEIIDSFFKN